MNQQEILIVAIVSNLIIWMAVQWRINAKQVKKLIEIRECEARRRAEVQDTIIAFISDNYRRAFNYFTGGCCHTTQFNTNNMRYDLWVTFRNTLPDDEPCEEMVQKLFYFHFDFIIHRPLMEYINLDELLAGAVDHENYPEAAMYRDLLKAHRKNHPKQLHEYKTESASFVPKG